MGAFADEVRDLRLGPAGQVDDLIEEHPVPSGPVHVLPGGIVDGDDPRDVPPDPKGETGESIEIGQATDRRLDHPLRVVDAHQRWPCLRDRHRHRLLGGCFGPELLGQSRQQSVEPGRWTIEHTRLVG